MEKDIYFILLSRIDRREMIKNEIDEEEFSDAD